MKLFAPEIKDERYKMRWHPLLISRYSSTEKKGKIAFIIHPSDRNRIFFITKMSPGKIARTTTHLIKRTTEKCVVNIDFMIKTGGDT